ncbi:MAG: 50S ribosomal protein L17 [Chloroflexota bacterium]
MRHRVAGRQFGRPGNIRRAMFRTQVTDLLRHESITTTTPKAKEVRKFAEKMISRGKEDSVHARREAAKFITDKDVVRKLFDEIAPRYSGRNGGYTRMLKLPPRKGDGADVAVLELVDRE